MPVSRANRSVAVLSSLDHTAITEQFFGCDATVLTSQVLLRLQWIFCHPQAMGLAPKVQQRFGDQYGPRPCRWQKPHPGRKCWVAETVP